ncbi:MAG: hypothetical protein PHG93_06145 [Candidatus Methanomethylophilaceae archaeon]|nr:hypothetical protein [Candidatus Methanomethylophilaceae archaeon]
MSLEIITSRPGEIPPLIEAEDLIGAVVIGVEEVESAIPVDAVATITIQLRNGLCVDLVGEAADDDNLVYLWKHYEGNDD